MLIRPATLADAATIEDIYQYYVLTSTATYQEVPGTLAERETWLQSHGPQHPVLVLEMPDAGVVGWASLSPFRPRSAFRHTVEISIYLRDGWQGRSLGGSLMEQLIREARSLGHHSIIALISQDQPASARLHARHGFKFTGCLQEVGLKFERWLSLEMWQLLLKA